MSGVDLDKVLAELSNGDSGLKDNSDSLLGLAKEVNNVLSEFEKTVQMLDNMHVLPALVRGLGKKYDIDVDTPLKSDKGIKPATDYHKLVFDQLNAMTEAEVGKALLEGASKGNETKKAE